MIEEKEDPRACVAVEVRSSLPAMIIDHLEPRIGREVFERASGKSMSEALDHSMGYVRSPNKSPEPTTTAGTSAAELPRVPAAVVAHL